MFNSDDDIKYSEEFYGFSTMDQSKKRETEQLKDETIIQEKKSNLTMERKKLSKAGTNVLINIIVLILGIIAFKTYFIGSVSQLVLIGVAGLCVACSSISALFNFIDSYLKYSKECKNLSNSNSEEIVKENENLEEINVHVNSKKEELTFSNAMDEKSINGNLSKADYMKLKELLEYLEPNNQLDSNHEKQVNKDMILVKKLK